MGVNRLRDRNTKQLNNRLESVRMFGPVWRVQGYFPGTVVARFSARNMALT